MRRSTTIPAFFGFQILLIQTAYILVLYSPIQICKLPVHAVCHTYSSFATKQYRHCTHYTLQPVCRQCCYMVWHSEACSLILWSSPLYVTLRKVQIERLGFQQQATNKAAQQDGTSNEANPINVLGMNWATTTNCLSLKNLHHRTNIMTTKQEELRDISKWFGPLGITSPVSVRANCGIYVLTGMSP